MSRKTTVLAQQSVAGVDNSSDEAASLRAEIQTLVERYAEVAHKQKPFVAGESRVLVSGKVYDHHDIGSLVDSSLDFWLTTGRFNREFERKLAKFIGVRHALTVNSGSSANLVAVTALTSELLRDERLVPGDEVITCATGFPTTVNPLIQNGLRPVFLDVELGTYNIDVARLEEALTPRTRAVVAAHALGNPFDLGAIQAFVKKHDLLLIEDCCDALGATYDGKSVGTFGAFGTVSFYPAHHITMGEGGAVFTNNPIYRRAAEAVRDWGRDCYCEPGFDNTCGRRFDWQLGDLPFGYDHKYTYSHLGYNLKITDMQASIGVTQMDKLPGFVAARRRNFDRLKEGLKPIEHLLLLPRETENSQASWFGFPITVRADAKISRNDVVKKLNEAKVDTRLLFGGNLIKQPYMKDRDYRVVGDLTSSDMVMTNTFWVGVFPGLTDAHIDYMVEAITKVMTE
jgi:CDP-6-deoxy-D-xylo-4-hexulose-3-dehydrase